MDFTPAQILAVCEAGVDSAPPGSSTAPVDRQAMERHFDQRIAQAREQAERCRRQWEGYLQDGSGAVFGPSASTLLGLQSCAQWDAEAARLTAERARLGAP